MGSVWAGVGACRTLLSLAFAGSAAAQQVIYTDPVTAAVVSVPPYGVPCGGFYPYNPTYAYPVAPWCPAMTRSTYPATTSRQVVYSRPLATTRVAYVRPRRVLYRTAFAYPTQRMARRAAGSHPVSF